MRAMATPPATAPRLGLDYSARPATPDFAAEANTRGFSFAIRYLCFPDTRPINRTKILTPDEARTLSQAGIDVGLVWQDSKHDAQGGAAVGAIHGAEARREADAVGAPPGAWIYFAVGDYDAPTADHGRIAEYLSAAAAQLGPYKPAGYGKRSVLEDMHRRGLIQGVWQSYGFSRPIGEISSLANVYQRREQTTVAGVLCDVNEARTPEFGVWRTGGRSMAIVKRQQWGARPAKRVPLSMPTDRLWLHHSAVEWHGAKGVRQTQAFHMDSRGWKDIAYSFLVDDDGTIYEGRGAGFVGAHTEGDNSRSHAICAMGNFDVRQPTRAMLDSIADLVRHGHAQGWWGRTITGGHRDAPNATTACPGRHLHAAIQVINAAAVRRADSPAPSPVQEDDMERRYVVVDVPAPDEHGRQIVPVPDLHFERTGPVSIKANDNGVPVRGTVQTFRYGDALVLSFTGTDGGALTPGKVGVVIAYQP